MDSAINRSHEIIKALRIETASGPAFPHLCEECRQRLSRGKVCRWCLVKELDGLRFKTAEGGPTVRNEIEVDDTIDDGTPPDIA